MSSDLKQSPPFQRVAVIGGGAWGTALATVLARNGRTTTLWIREPDVAREAAKTRVNAAFLPGVDLPDALEITADLAAAVAEADAIVFVAPVQFSRPLLQELAAHRPDGPPLLLCSKGIERATGAFMTDIAADLWPTDAVAALSGPSFAADVARGLPTAVTLADPDRARGERWIATVGAPTFRPYWTDDLLGVELGGAAKNVLAIACGVCEGLRLGDSAKAALMARGYAEMARLGAAIGARAETLGGLAGLGDLILTCGSRQSRNMSLGVALGEGRSMDEVLGERRSVAEGAATSEALVKLAEEKGVETPIAKAVDALVAGRVTVSDAMRSLLARPFRAEGL
ncbi:MAG: NAD(P)H-dependent glycerol-3-phosphate dehydrogenase [Pseudomonadota bacterium]